jgi:hypothetical protein
LQCGTPANADLRATLLTFIPNNMRYLRRQTDSIWQGADSICQQAYFSVPVDASLTQENLPLMARLPA